MGIHLELKQLYAAFCMLPTRILLSCGGKEDERYRKWSQDYNKDPAEQCRLDSPDPGYVQANQSADEPDNGWQIWRHIASSNS